MTSKNWIGCCVLAAGAAASAQSFVLRPGQYETVTKIEMPKGAGAVPDDKDAECVTAADVKDLAARLFDINDSPECKISDRKTSPSHLAFTTTCNEPGGVTTTKTLTMELAADSFRAVVVDKSPDGVVTVTKTGKRTGNCAP